jgi:hypothetical protein
MSIGGAGGRMAVAAVLTGTLRLQPYVDNPAIWNIIVSYNKQSCVDTVQADKWTI